MWYTVPEGKEEQKEALDVLLRMGLFDDFSADAGFYKQMEGLLEAYFDEKKFDEKAYDGLYQIYDNLGGDNDKTKEEMFPGDHSHASFKKEFEKVWKIMSYNALADDFLEESELDALQDARLKQIEQEKAEKKQKDAEQEALKAQERLKKELEEKQRQEARKAEQEKQELESLQKRNDEAFLASQSLQKNEAALQKESETVMKALEENDERYGNATLAMGENRGKELKAFAEAVEKSQKEIEKKLDAKLDGVQTEYDQTLKIHRRVESKIDGYLVKYPDLVNYDPNIQKKIDNYKKNLANFVVKKPEYDRVDQKAFKEFKTQWYGYMERVNNGFHEAKRMLDQMPKLTESLKNQRQKLAEDQKELDERRKDFANLTKEQKQELVQAQEKLNKQMKALQEKQKQANRQVLERVENNKKQLAADQKKIDARMKKPDVAFEDGYETVMLNEYVDRKNLANQRLKYLYDDFKHYFERLMKQKNAHDQEQREILKRREEMEDILEAVSNLPAKEHWYKSAPKETQVFTDVRIAVKDYLDDRGNQEKAKKAYDECRNYMKTYMKEDRSGMKSGSKTENTRHQSVVRMLELMDQLPEFEAFTEKEAPKSKNVFGWENLERDDVVNDTYTKLNFQELENSLAKHATSKKVKSQDPKKQKKAFANLNRRIEKTKEKKAKEQQNQPKK